MEPYMADVVVITGGSAGIGRAAAQQFAARGCAVGLIARGQERLDNARAELEALGARVHSRSWPIPTDVPPWLTAGTPPLMAAAHIG